ncbi:hypothetical protein Tco_0357639 [Tanacetum coccineum]
MADFVPGRAVIDAAQSKRSKYMTKCADIGYGFLPFSFSSFEELEKDAVTLLKWVRKFFMAQDIGARAAVHIFNRINFFIAKGVGAQIVSRLPSNLLEPFTRSPNMYKEYLAEFWYSTKALENSKVFFFIPTGGIYDEVMVNTFRNAIGAHYLPYSSEYVALPSIDIVRSWFETTGLSSV